MSEAYWLGGLHRKGALPSDVEQQALFNERLDLLQSLASKTGVNPARLSRVDWFTGRMNGLYRREVFNPDGAKTPLAFLWPSLPLLNHTLLRDACAALAREETLLAALVEENQDSSQAVLLGSPTAVGKFNLAPQARFDAHLGAAWEESPLTDTFEAVAAFLRKLEVDPAAIGALALSSPFELDSFVKPEAWQSAAWFSAPTEAGLLEPLHWLVGNLPSGLPEDRPSLGLLVSLSADRRALFTLVEKV